MTIPKTGMVVVVAAVMALLAGAVNAQTQLRQINVTGEGSVQVVPDMATITMGVTNQASQAKAAMDATSAAVARVLDRLDAMGIDSKDIQTQRFSLSPVWSDRNGANREQPEIIGFRASNTVLVKIRDLDDLGPILDAVIADGANDFNGLRFDVQQPRPLLDAARKDAVQDGIAQAQLLADAAGVTLGPVVSISDHSGNGPRPMMMEMAAARAGAAPVAAGEVTVAASVSMVFAILD